MNKSRKKQKRKKSREREADCFEIAGKRAFERFCTGFVFETEEIIGRNVEVEGDFANNGFTGFAFAGFPAGDHRLMAVDGTCELLLRYAFFYSQFFQPFTKHNLIIPKYAKTH